MKKYIGWGMIGLLVVLAFLQIERVDAQVTDPEFALAVKWMHTNGLTQYSDLEAFRPGDYLTREEAAKFFVAFQQTVAPEKPVPLIACLFNDSSTFDATLENYIFTSCQMGLFKGTDGAFLPQHSLTKAQALAVLVRALEGSQDETTTPWWNNYFKRATALGLTKERNVLALDVPVTRYEMALLLYRAANGGWDADEQELLELLEILLKLGISMK